VWYKVSVKKNDLDYHIKSLIKTGIWKRCKSLAMNCNLTQINLEEGMASADRHDLFHNFLSRIIPGRVGSTFCCYCYCCCCCWRVAHFLRVPSSSIFHESQLFRPVHLIQSRLYSSVNWSERQVIGSRNYFSFYRDVSNFLMVRYVLVLASLITKHWLYYSLVIVSYNACDALCPSWFLRLPGD